jgi:hypothetical protein
MGKKSVNLSSIMTVLLGILPFAKAQAAEYVLVRAPIEVKDEASENIIMEHIQKRQIKVKKDGSIVVPKTLFQTLKGRGIIKAANGGGDGTDSDTTGPKGGGGFDK